ncbi:MAG: hypothetical protein A2W03_08825 [Candidatus Aminicenantes bacterium RBG_16_63_16]|nr:MAG: hypothetical protein A2W03_08825 [Candidatus Aminicenantes bacterium RBG_16_63_16]
MRFVVDVMLGKLAKWLRILGFDAAYGNRAGDRELVQTARRERRVLLTRDHLLLQSAKNIRGLLIESDDWRRQLDQVLDAFGLRDRARPLSRCLACNVGLKRLSRKNARNLVAPFVFERAPTFSICPGCGRIYWPGTHFGDMDRKLAEILGRRGELGSVASAAGRTARKAL